MTDDEYTDSLVFKSCSFCEEEYQVQEEMERCPICDIGELTEI